MRKVKALWNIASEKDKKVAVVGYWPTWPPEEINGSMVSDHTAYHFLFEEGATGGPGRTVNTYPPDLSGEGRSAWCAARSTSASTSCHASST